MEDEEHIPEPLGVLIRYVRGYIESWERFGLAFAVIVCAGIFLNADFYLSKTDDNPANFFLFTGLFLLLTLCYSAVRLLKIEWDASEIAKMPIKNTAAIILVSVLYLVEFGVFPLSFMYVIWVDAQITMLRFTEWPPNLFSLISNLSLIASVLSPFFSNRKRWVK